MMPPTLMTDEDLAREWLAAQRAVDDPVDDQERERAEARQLEIEREQARRESAPDSSDFA